MFCPLDGDTQEPVVFLEKAEKHQSKGRGPQPWISQVERESWFSLLTYVETYYAMVIHSGKATPSLKFTQTDQFKY